MQNRYQRTLYTSDSPLTQETGNKRWIENPYSSFRAQTIKSTTGDNWFIHKPPASSATFLANLTSSRNRYSATSTTRTVSTRAPPPSCKSNTSSQLFLPPIIDASLIQQSNTRSYMSKSRRLSAFDSTQSSFMESTHFYVNDSKVHLSSKTFREVSPFYLRKLEATSNNKDEHTRRLNKSPFQPSKMIQLMKRRMDSARKVKEHRQGLFEKWRIYNSIFDRVVMSPPGKKHREVAVDFSQLLDSLDYGKRFKVDYKKLERNVDDAGNLIIPKSLQDEGVAKLARVQQATMGENYKFGGNHQISSATWRPEDEIVPYPRVKILTTEFAPIKKFNDGFKYGKDFNISNSFREHALEFEERQASQMFIRYFSAKMFTCSMMSKTTSNESRQYVSSDDCYTNSDDDETKNTSFEDFTNSTSSSWLLASVSHEDEKRPTQQRKCKNPNSLKSILQIHS